MARIIKAPNIQIEKPYRVVEREKVIRHAEEDAMDILISAQSEAEQIIEAAQREVQHLIEQAKQEANQVIQTATAEANQIKEDAAQKGMIEGKAKGEEQARKTIAGLVQDLKTMTVEGQKILEGLFANQEQEIKSLVREIVARVIQAKIEEDDEIVVRITKKCIGLAADRQSIRILIHPEDKTKIEAWAPEFTRLYDDIEKVRIEIDPRVQRGGVMIESGTGGIDGRIDKQLEIFNESIGSS
ncbi:MAG: FliH/SctL family protein [bacterium]|jgi:flagellar biosynthesis/type III secretory pathway protein FliH|nr:FliH/SctL family protein [bacterium]